MLNVASRQERELEKRIWTKLAAVTDSECTCTGKGGKIRSKKMQCNFEVYSEVNGVLYTGMYDNNNVLPPGLPLETFISLADVLRVLYRHYRTLSKASMELLHAKSTSTPTL